MVGVGAERGTPLKNRDSPNGFPQLDDLPNNVI